MHPYLRHATAQAHIDDLARTAARRRIASELGQMSHPFRGLVRRKEWSPQDRRRIINACH